MRRDRALAQLVTELERARSFAVAVGDAPADGNPHLPEGDVLASTVVSTLETSAEALEGGGHAPDLHALEQARLDHRIALDACSRLSCSGDRRQRDNRRRKRRRSP
jgi:hypothetical protein